MNGATVARIVVATRARARLSAHAGRWPVRTHTSWSGQDHVLLVLGSAIHDGRPWLHVLLPYRPTGVSGWIPRDVAQLSRTRYWLEVHTRRRWVVAYRDGHLARRFRAVVGKAATPTPHGLAALYERNRQPDPRGFLGPWSLPLTAFSPVLANFGGGPGRVAIHGRAGASLRDPLGSARSHGCIRISNVGIRYLAHVPAGTPVDLMN